MKIFQEWKKNKEEKRSQKRLQEQIKKDSITIINSIKELLYTHQTFRGRYERYLDINPTSCVEILNAAKQLQTPFSQLNKNVGVELMDVVIGSKYNQLGIDLLCSFLDQGYPLNTAMVERLKYFEKEKYFAMPFAYDGRNQPKTSFDMWYVFWHPVYNEFEKKSEVKKGRLVHHDVLSDMVPRLLKAMKVLTAFGADWSTPSCRNPQYKTIAGFLSHYEFENGDQSIKQYLEALGYSDLATPAVQLTSSEDILNQRLGEALLQDGEIEIQTGQQTTGARQKNEVITIC